jgi:MFS family permease
MGQVAESCRVGEQGCIGSEARMRQTGGVVSAARAVRGLFALNLPVSSTVRRNFRLELIAATFAGLFNGSAGGYILVVARTIGVSQFGVSVLVAMPAVGAIVALPVSVATKGGNSGRRVMFASWYAGRLLLLLLFLFSAPLPYLLIASSFYITSSIAGPFYAGVIQHIYPAEFRGRLMSLVRVGSGAATTSATLLTAWLLGSGIVTYQVVFGVGGLLLIASTVVFAWVTPVRPPPRPRQSFRDTLAIMRRDRPFARYQTWVFLMGGGNIISATLYPLVIVDKLHAGYGPFGVLSVIAAVGYLCSWFVWGRVVDRLGPVFTIMVVGICVMTLPIGMVLAPSVYWLAPALFITGIGNAGFEIGPLAAVMHYATGRPHDVPLYMALHSTLAGIRGLIMPFVATLVLAGNHYTLTLCIALSITGFGTFKLWRLDRAVRRAAKPQIGVAPRPTGRPA